MLHRRILRPSVSTPSIEACVFCVLRSCQPASAKRNYGRGAAPRARSTRDTTRQREEFTVPHHEVDRVIREENQLILDSKIRAITRAYNDGILKIEPDVADTIARRFLDIRKNVSVDDVRAICEESKTPLADLTSLSRVLVNCPFPHDRAVGRRILLAASRAGEPSATIFALAAAMNQGQLHSPELVSVKTQLEKLVRVERNPQAMILTGRIAEREGNLRRALALYEQAIEEALKQGDDATNDRSIEDAGIYGAWIHLGQVKLVLCDRPGATAAFEAGVLANGPLAFAALSDLEDDFSPRWLLYKTKAATSGHARCAYDLGRFYSLSDDKVKDLRKQERAWAKTEAERAAKAPKAWSSILTALAGLSPYQQLSQLSPQERDFFASEWFFIAGTSGHGPGYTAAAHIVCKLGKNWTLADIYRSAMWGPDAVDGVVKAELEMMVKRWESIAKP
ncbi:hypothetical protein BJ546DRAFT_649762 [Cryomyces antarcticus]